MGVFISAGSFLFAPFHCVGYPNGLQTVWVHQQIICGKSELDEHRNRVIAAAVASSFPDSWRWGLWIVFSLPKHVCRANANLWHICAFRLGASRHVLVVLYRHLAKAQVPSVSVPAIDLFNHALPSFHGQWTVLATNSGFLPIAFLDARSTINGDSRLPALLLIAGCFVITSFFFLATASSEAPTW